MRGQIRCSTEGVVIELHMHISSLSLQNKRETHINVSLEMLLKLVAVFGPVIISTISAAPTVGVDLHAEKRMWTSRDN
ncbi:hypothetical protein L2E82_07985 [Cichorium intybus]|uniref:Uncharacterized protein n=1 Tax=Cichorium intybus TaxID=13427 RepID=A0ACB9G4Z8_CICIN|nr:hypothetical protein L2E82_07985 [Cichorium intybus]